jgi:hypothetical protein
MAAVALDASPMSFVRSLCGAIVDARIAHPHVIHLAIRDSQGEIWRLASQDAGYSRSDPRQLIEHSIEEAQIDTASRGLRCGAPP